MNRRALRMLVVISAVLVSVAARAAPHCEEPAPNVYDKPNVRGGLWGRDIDLIHDEEGRLRTRLPDHPTEQDRFHVIAVVPRQALPSARIIVAPCDQAPSIRVFGKAVAINAPLEAPHGLNAVPDLCVLRADPPRCAGTFSYRLVFDAPDATPIKVEVAIQVDPVYLLWWGAALAFDFGKPRHFSLVDRPAAGGSTEKFVSESNSYSGVRPILFIALHPCRANPKNWQPCDWIAPFVGIDPGAAGDGFVAGLELAPYPGVGIIGGVSVFKSDTIDAKAGVAPGDAFTATGNLPKASEFNKDSVGAFVGVSVSSEVFGLLFK